MAQYVETFAGNLVGSTPSGWTPRWQTANGAWQIAAGGDIGGRIVWPNASVAARRLLSFNSVDSDPSRANVDLLIRARALSHTLSFRCYAVVRASGDAGEENGYWAALSETSGFTLRRYVNGVVTELASVTYRWSANTWYWIRLRAQGDQLLAKIWREHELEPQDWMISVTDSTHSDPGWSGVATASNFSLPVEFDWVSVGTGGDTAPMVVSTGPLRLTQVPLEYLGQSDAPSMRLTQQVAEALTQSTDPPSRLTQLVVEVMTSNFKGIYFSQQVLEAVSKRFTRVNYSQQVLEVVSKRSSVQHTPSSGKRRVHVVSG